MSRCSILFAILASSSAIFAAPVGNPATPQMIDEGFFIPPNFGVSARIGYEGDFVADGQMEQYREGSGRVDCYQQETNSGTITLNILDRVDCYAILGSSRTSADWRYTDIDEAVHRIELETYYDFLWGGGIRGILYEGYGVCVGLGGRFEAANFSPNWLTSDAIPQATSGTSLNWREWQIDLDLSYKIDILTPYVGVKYSNARVKIKGFETAISQNNSGENQLKNRVPVGMVIGCSLSTSKYFMLNLEGRLIDEEAVTVSGDIRF